MKLLLISLLLTSCASPSYRIKTKTTWRYTYSTPLDAKKAPNKPFLSKRKAIRKAKPKIDCAAILSNINKCSLEVK